MGGIEPSRHVFSSSDDLGHIERLMRELLDAAASVRLALFRCLVVVLDKARDGGFDS